MLLILFLVGVALAVDIPSNQEPRQFEHMPPGYTPSARSKCTDDNSECWGFVDVRSDAHLFYWLYYTTHSEGTSNRPLVIWLQGGPGGSSTGYGNFEIIGPLDVNLKPRETTWIQTTNVLFPDNPVGAGYSYVDNTAAYTRDVDEVAEDFTVFMRSFIKTYPEFSTTPVYIFGQSYGGKMAAVISQYLRDDINAGNLKLNLAGFAMGNSWIHPVDLTTTWGDLLYSMSAVDEDGYDKINVKADLSAEAVASGNYKLATSYWRQTQTVVFAETNYIDFYNILNYVTFGAYNRTSFRSSPFGGEYDLILGPMAQRSLYTLMNGQIRAKLEIIPSNVIWDGQSDNVFYYQEGDFMKDVIYAIDDILANTDQDVIVYQGQLDLICDTLGAMQWTQRLKWPSLPTFNKQTRYAYEHTDGQTDLYSKAHGNFKFYWVLRAGHSVPADNGHAALKMLNRIIDNQDK